MRILCDLEVNGGKQKMYGNSIPFNFTMNAVFCVAKSCLTMLAAEYGMLAQVGEGVYTFSILHAYHLIHWYSLCTHMSRAKVK